MLNKAAANFLWVAGRAANLKEWAERKTAGEDIAVANAKIADARGHLERLRSKLGARYAQAEEEIEAVSRELQASRTNMAVSARALVESHAATWDFLALVPRARIIDVSESLARACRRRVVSGALVGAPDLSRLPFPVCWFSVEGSAEGLCRSLDLETQDAKSVVPGFLVTREGMLYLVVGHDASVTDDEADVFAIPMRLVDQEGWDVVHLHWAWLTYLLSEVTRLHMQPHAPKFRRDLSLTRRLGDLRKHGVVMPPPELYEIHLDSRRAGHVVGRVVSAHNGPSYRYEVRKHLRMHVRRGKWPCPPDERDALVKKLYFVERGDECSEETLLELSARDLPAPTREEWIAWKLVEVTEHERGPEGPVVHGTRVLAGGNT